MDVGTIIIILITVYSFVYVAYKQHQMIVKLKKRLDDLEGDGK